ncbi:MAG TPA: hypothetical protein PLH29_03635 [bacterium]|nr:hypothetical protein [bacterium]
MLVNGNIGGDKICTADGLICHDIASLSSGGGGYKILRGFVSVTFTNGQPESQHLPVTFPELCNNPTVIAVAKDYSNSIKCGTISGPSLCCNNTSSLSQDLDAVVSLITTNGFTTWLTGDCGVWADDHPTYPIDWLAICDSAGGGGTNWWSQFENNIYNNNPGNVGVGVNSPAYKLHVNGDVNATRLCINGNCKTNWPVEDDPQVGTLTNGRWCTSNGNVVNCNQTAPLMSYTEIDPKVGTITVGGWCRGSTASLLNCNNSLPVPRLICADVNRVTTPTQLSCTQTCASWYTNGACIGAADHGDPNFHGYVRDCDIIDSGIPGCRCCRVSW